MDAYIVREGGAAEAMDRVHCSDEIRDLQDLLSRNHQLLPGDQISPDDPCRWLLIKREMPVPDPSTGADRWNVDFFFADQAAMPTFVECKRLNDTDSRRKVVGQVLDYAANGLSYWTREKIQEYARDSAPGKDLDKALREIRCTEDLSVEDFFGRVEDNLKKGQIRIIFYLDEAPWELKRIVGFLNDQMEKSEVLLVEARQYSRDGIRVIVPSLFGYTEQARLIKRIDVSKPQGTVEWDWDAFKAQALANKLDAPDMRAIWMLYDSFKPETFFGKGKTASLNVRCRSVSNASALSVTSFGVLYLNFVWLTNGKAAPFRDRLREIAVHVGLEVPDDYTRRAPAYQASVWTPKVEALISSMRQLFSAFSSGPGDGDEQP